MSIRHEWKIKVSKLFQRCSLPHFTRGRVRNIFFTLGRVVSKRGASWLKRGRVGGGRVGSGASWLGFEESSRRRFGSYVHVKNWNFLFYCSNIAKSENAMLWRMLSRLEACIVYCCIWSVTLAKSIVPRKTWRKCLAFLSCSWQRCKLNFQYFLTMGV
jgi:hypothetical protein